MSGRLRALSIDDSPEDADVLERHLRQSGYALTLRRVDHPATLPQILAAEPWDVALCKFVTPGLKGRDVLEILRSAAPDLPAIAVAEEADDEVALEVMRAGARDCVGKGSLARLAPVIDREVQAHGALRIASSWLRLAEDSAIVGFFFHDLQTDAITLSAQWCANLGYEPRETTETRADFEARLHPLDLDDIRQLIPADVAAGRRAASREFRLRQRDGSYRWVLARTAVRHRRERHAGARGRCSHRRHRPQARRRRARPSGHRDRAAGRGSVDDAGARRAHRVREPRVRAALRLRRGRASVSHDLRAPLRHIDGFVRILEEDFSENLPAEAGRYLSLVRTGVGRMNVMIEALLRLSRLGHAALQPQRCDAGAIARMAFHELRAAEPERTVELTVGPLPEVTAAPALLRQVYDNLLANALEFTRPVAEPRIEVGCERRDGRDEFFVRDTA